MAETQLNYAKPGPYITNLSNEEESEFRTWIKINKIPWHEDEKSDYDMRGYWKANKSGDPNAKRATNLHFPDTWKTPYHKTFSNESIYATSKAPHWEGNKLVPTVMEQQTQEGQVSYADFANKIRAKYPQSKLYKSKPDKELVDAWIQAKPERAIYTKRIKGFDPLNEGGKGVPSGIPVMNRDETGRGRIELAQKNQMQHPTTDYIGAGLPAAGGMVGGIFGKTPGSAIGGAVGSMAKDLTARMLFDKETPNKEVAVNAIVEAGKQAALEKGGQLIGSVFFKLLSKIPHAAIKDGIPLLASEKLGGGNLSKYIEGLFTNLGPSAGTMAEFRANQTKAILGKLDTFVSGMSRFKGTSEEMGTILQKGVTDAKKDAWQSLMKIAQSKGIKTKGALYKLPEYKVFEEEFNDSLVKAIIKEEKPELIAGMIRGERTAGIQQVKDIQKLLVEKNPKVWEKVQSRLLRDVISETLMGSKDPVSKATSKYGATFSGKDFKGILDSIGEEKIKAIYGQETYDNLEHFVAITSRVGSSKEGMGKFMNLMLFISPIRSGLSPHTMMNVGKTAFIINRAAKIITSPEGVKAYEDYIRATGVGSVKLASAARDELNKYTERADMEYELERKEAEEEYNKAHKNKENK